MIDLTELERLAKAAMDDGGFHKPERDCQICRAMHEAQGKLGRMGKEVAALLARVRELEAAHGGDGFGACPIPACAAQPGAPCIPLAGAPVLHADLAAQYAERAPEPKGTARLTVEQLNSISEFWGDAGFPADSFPEWLEAALKEAGGE